MSPRYQVTFGEGEAERLEIIALERGISISLLVRESSMFGLLQTYWQGMIPGYLSSENIRIQLKAEGSEKEFEVIEIPSGFSTGYILSPIVDFPNLPTKPFWRILKTSPMGSVQETLWTNENNCLVPYPVNPGDRIRIILPLNIDIRTEPFRLTLKFYYRPLVTGPLIKL